MLYRCKLNEICTDHSINVHDVNINININNAHAMNLLLHHSLTILCTECSIDY